MSRLSINLLGLDERGELLTDGVLKLHEECEGWGCEKCDHTGLEYTTDCSPEVDAQGAKTEPEGV